MRVVILVCELEQARHRRVIEFHIEIAQDDKRVARFASRYPLCEHLDTFVTRILRQDIEVNIVNIKTFAGSLI